MDYSRFTQCSSSDGLEQPRWQEPHFLLPQEQRRQQRQEYFHNVSPVFMTKSRTASIQSEAAAGGDNSPFLDDMASNIRPLRRRLRLTKGRLVGRMTQERQKLSFFIVIMFLVIFGLNPRSHRPTVFKMLFSTYNLPMTPRQGPQ